MTSTPERGAGEAGAGIHEEVAALRREVEALRRRLDAVGSPQHPGLLDALYPAFQDRFRGDEDEVRRRLAVYLEDAEAASTGLGALDVGPGRGEWLSLLAERGVAASGVDQNAEQAARSRSQGLDVVHGDAVEHLRARPPRSLDVVTAFHVVEHLDVDTLLALLQAAREALRPGGRLVLETPHPSNLVMAACNFYLDPTHRHPLPPALTSFLLASSGFVDLEVRLLHPKEAADLGGLVLDGVHPDVSALVAEAVSKAFFGPQDYGVLARVPEDGCP